MGVVAHRPDQPRNSLGMSALRLPDALGDNLGEYAGAQWWYMVGHLAAAHDPTLLFSVHPGSGFTRERVVYFQVTYFANY